ncbi:uncharacterized protein LOC109412287 [Aedes albopictus]|uniref:DDB1- and CUL4-associated factor 15 WD40 repeat-containing domain-containing protein n=1 Tax=Aedes albopictus TaxID=7160 RepID=A0ABM1ZM79_AEDAL
MPLSPDWEDSQQAGCSSSSFRRKPVPSRFTGSNDSARCENVLLKVLNREHCGYFSTGLNKRSHREAFREVPAHLSFCLKEIVPYCYLKGHVFMGLSACGQFLLSYKASYDYEEVITNEYNFSSNYKYELYFWIYRPHFLLSKYFQVCLFDDHGVDDIKTVSITQWKTDQRLLIVHGASEKEDMDSYVTVVRVPKLGCMDCKQMRTADEEDGGGQGSLCINCNMTIHTKYRNSDSGPKFNPKYNLNCPGYIIMSENSFIHTINIRLDTSRCPRKVLSGVISSKYISKYPRMSPEIELKPMNLVEEKIFVSKSEPLKPSTSDIFPAPNLPAPSQSLSIADQIIADFAEYETETFESKCSQPMYSSLGHNRTTSRLSSSSSSSSRSHSTAVAQCPENFDELVITCDPRGPPATPRSSMITRGAAARLSEALSPTSNIRLMNHSNNTNIELRLTPDVHKSYVTRVELSAGSSSGPYSLLCGASQRSSAANSTKTQSPLESSGTPSCSSSSTPNGRTPLRRRSYLSIGSRSADPNVPSQTDGPNDVASKAYEFSEDNERCEKISIFRKRRLADKKYEFSEDSSHGDNVIVPFNRLRNQIRTRSTSQALICSPSHPGYEMTTHLHRASPNHGFRSPCGSPVGNRYLRSPPGIRSPNYYRHHSPVGTPRTTQTPQTAAQLIKMANFDPKDYIYPGGGGAATVAEDIPKFFIDAIQKFNEKKLQADDEGNNENFNSDNLLPLKAADLTGFGCSNGTTVQEAKPEKKPTCTKKIVKIFVEEDDANSVLTTEEDDCISPGYHASLPMEVHGSCYANMQIVSPSSYQKLNCPAVVVTQNSFDMEAFSFHVANHICAKHDKKYGILFDSAYELTHVCPLTETITCTMVLQFTASDASKVKQCHNCSTTIDCRTHRKIYQCRSLFTWNITSGEWTVLDYGSLESGPYLEVKKLASNYNRLLGKLRKFTRKLFHPDSDELDSNRTYEYLGHLRVLDSNNEKTKQRLVDPLHLIEFFRKQPHDTGGDSDDSDDDDESMASSLGSSGHEEEEEEEEDNTGTVLEGDALTSEDTVSDEDDI